MESIKKSSKNGDKVRGYRGLVAWQKSIDLVTEIYKVTDEFPKEEVYGLQNQIRRAAVSVPSNIAEGQARETKADFARFLRISLGSLADVDTQLEIAEQLGYQKNDHIEKVDSLATEIRKILFGLINSLK